LAIFASGADRLATLAPGDVESFVAPLAQPAALGPFDAACLLPAAIAGVDIVRLLVGAEAAGAQFRSGPPEAVAALRLAALGHLRRPEAGGFLWRFAAWAEGFVPIGRWLESVLVEIAWPGPSPRPVAITLDPAASRALPSLVANRSPAIVAHLMVDAVRRDRIPLAEPSRRGQADEQPESLPQLAAAEQQAVERELAAIGIPQSTIHLPRLDEASLGQFMQIALHWVDLERRLASDG
jgi:hypothetical protein